ncbi:SNF2 domain-containing protein CLASSY 1 [Cardamine amara subsp. amara]|uniref:SNF2 domain-containing protein CLASSY 1 n=1 Tax=Cardamine amara subsp. amara TaxID=228776 RepID=A0ABD1B0K5_CARAN
MKRKHYYELNHPFNPCPFEVFCSGTWKAVEYLRIENGMMTMRLLENGLVLDDIRPFQRLRLRSRKATLFDCTSFLRPGLDVCILYQKDVGLDEETPEPVWVDAKILSIERKPHESECLCKFHVSIYMDQGCIGSEKHRMNRASVVVGLNQISILQKFFNQQTFDQYYRWRYSEDCTSLVKTRLTLGKFLPDLTWLLVTSVMKRIGFHIRAVHEKMVFQIVNDDDCQGSSSSLSAMNITVEDGVYMSKVVSFNPAEDTHEDTDVKEEIEEEVMELRRSKRRSAQPDRFAYSESQPDSKDGWVRMMPYRYSTWTVSSDDDEDFCDDDRDTDDDLYLPLSHLLGRKGSAKGYSKKKDKQIVLVDKTEKKKRKKTEGFSRRNRELSVIPFTPVFEPIPLEQFGLNANSLCGSDFSSSHLMDEINKYRSKASKYGKKKKMEMEDMESDLCWNGPTGKLVQKGNRSYSRIRSVPGNSEEPQIYKKRTLSAGAYNKLIDSYMSRIESTIGAKEETTNVVEKWEELKNTASSSMEAEETSTEDDDDEGETSDNEMLWREMELCLASSYILDDNEARVDNEAFQKATGDCEHDYELNEEIGMCCRLCGHVGTEIKHVSAPFAQHKKWTTESKQIDEDDIRTTKVNQDGIESRNFTIPVAAASNIPSAEESENVWSLIPQLKRKLHFHQQKAFEFLWRNLAGSVVPVMMDPNSEKIGGCVVSHTPGAGKTFLIIAFLTSYLKIFPGKRPLVLAPKTTLYTWYKEFIKWEIPVPVHLIHGRRTYCMSNEKTIQFNGIPKPSQDVMHVLDSLDKIQKWHAQPSVLVMGYTSFLTLMREDSKFAHRNYMAKVLRESPGLLVLDEGHNPRSTKSRLRKALMKVDTDLRIMLSGTLFQNNFCEYFNTLCLARPKFVHEVLRELDPKFETTQIEQKAPHLLENRARKFFLDIIAKKIDTKGGDERLQGLNMLKNMTSSFIDNYEGSGSGDVLPGLQIYTLLMNSSDIQHKTLYKLQNIMSNYHGYPLELELLITLAAIHPWLVKTSTCCAKFFNPAELFEIEKLKHDAKKGSKVMFVLNLVFRVVKREKILIFCHNIAPIRLFLELFESVFRWNRGQEILTLTGDLELFDRGRVIDKFEEPGGPSRVLLASITACAEGISLTAASRVIMLDSEWNPSKTKQAIARAFRPGQQKVVYVYQLLSRGTLEEDKYRRTTWKEWVSSMIFSEEFVEDPSQWQAEKIEDDVLREIVAEDKVKSFHMIMKNEKASTGG